MQACLDVFCCAASACVFECLCVCVCVCLNVCMCMVIISHVYEHTNVSPVKLNKFDIL